MLGLALDGVLVQKQPVTYGTFDISAQLHPIFLPRKEFVLLVNRDPLSIGRTSAWITKHLPIQPKHVVYSKELHTDLRSRVNFYVKACKEFGITRLVESDYECLLRVNKESESLECIPFSDLFEPLFTTPD